MKKNILEIYALAVCFFAVLCSVITLGLTSWNVVEFAAPEFTLPGNMYSCHQTDDAYKKCIEGKYRYTRKEAPEILPKGQQLTDARIAAYDSIIHNERRQAVQGIVQKIIILMINALVFFGHWRLAMRSRETCDEQGRSGDREKWIAGQDALMDSMKENK